MSYFQEPYSCSENKIKDELDFSNHPTKSDLKKVTGVDAPDSDKNPELAGLKLDIDR